MKKFVVFITMVAMVFSLTSMAWADSATKEEAVAKCKEAVKLIQDKGLDAGKKEIGSKTGPFVWKDSYVFLMDLAGNVLAHPMVPELTERKDLLTVENSDGKFLFKEFIKLANEKGQGWVDYMFPKPGNEDPVAKTTYIERVPGTQYLVGAGIYK